MAFLGKFKVKYNKFHQNLIENIFELLFESVMTSNYGIYSFENELSFNHYSRLETVTAPMKFKFWGLIPCNISEHM